MHNVKLAGDGGGFSYKRLTDEQITDIQTNTVWTVEIKLAGTPWASYSLFNIHGELVRRSELDTYLEIDAAVPVEDVVPEEPTKEYETVPELWSVITTEVYSDGSIKVRRQSGHEFNEVPVDAGAEVGSFENKHPFDYSHGAPGVPDALIGLPGQGQAPGYDSKHGESWELPKGWVLNRGSSSGWMYLSGYDEHGTIIFMDFPQIASADPNNTYTKGNPQVVRSAT